jgi:opacity protein-like surface antigen
LIPHLPALLALASFAAVASPAEGTTAPSVEETAPPPEDPPADPAPPTEEPPEEPPTDKPPLTAAEQRRKEREAHRAWIRSLPQREADFLSTHTDLKVRLAFNGYTPGPFSIVTSLAGWNELSLTLDRGVASWRDFTIGFGGALHYGQALILGSLTQPIANYDEVQFRWSMWEAGGTLRATMHYTRLQSVDPYLMVGAGAGNFHLEARVRDWPLTTQERRNIPYLRVEVGAGLSTWLGRSRWIIGGELRYIVSSQFGAEKELLLSHDDGSTETFSLFPAHKPPKGFSWIAHVGYRF